MVSNMFQTNVWDYAQFEGLFWMGKSDTLGALYYIILYIYYIYIYYIYIYYIYYILSPSLWVIGW